MKCVRFRYIGINEEKNGEYGSLKRKVSFFSFRIRGVFIFCLEVFRIFFGGCGCGRGEGGVGRGERLVCRV